MTLGQSSNPGHFISPFGGDGSAYECEHKKSVSGGFPGGAVVENLTANAGDTGSSPGLGRSHMPRSN